VDYTITRAHLVLRMTHSRGGFLFPSRRAGGSLSLSLSLWDWEFRRSCSTWPWWRPAWEQRVVPRAQGGVCECARSATPRRENRARHGRLPTPSWTTRFGVLQAFLGRAVSEFTTH